MKRGLYLAPFDELAVPRLLAELARVAESRGGTACSCGIGSRIRPRTAPWPTRVITVPTITLEGDANGAPHPDPSSYAGKFSGRYLHRMISGGIGHDLPQEAPQAFADAVLEVDTY